ncbi:MAG: hypothetical protein JW780_08235 [Clostridiales bacterium]|nr:hypothetical protein [Clostridiales bacterium]
MNEASVPGLQKKSFAMFFDGGEIWFEHLDGIFRFSDAAVAKLSEDYCTFKRPSSPGLIAVIIDETAVTDELAESITQILLLGEKRFMKVAFVDTDGRGRRVIKKALAGAPFPISFISDLEKAKEWLIPI